MLPPTRSPRYRDKEASLWGLIKGVGSSMKNMSTKPFRESLVTHRAEGILRKNPGEGFSPRIQNQEILGKATPTSNSSTPPTTMNIGPKETQSTFNYKKFDTNPGTGMSYGTGKPVPPKPTETTNIPPEGNAATKEVENKEMVKPEGNAATKEVKNTETVKPEGKTTKKVKNKKSKKNIPPEGNVPNTNTPTNNNTPSGATNNTPQDPNNQNNFMQSVKDHFASDHFKNNANWYLGGAVGGAAALGAGGLATGYMLAPPKRRD